MMHPFPALRLLPLTRCKICGKEAPRAGAVDFNKNCAGPSAGLAVSGIAIPYYRCAECGFLFTCAFDGWSFDDFRREIYNDAYLRIDPDYAGMRARNNANTIEELFGPHRAALTMLDYGGGNGALARELRDRSFPSTRTYDPFDERHATIPDTRFDIVTCFEMLEHVPDPLATIGQIVAVTDPGGLVMFSTAAQPMDVGLHDGYVAPRNGHISIFTKPALVRAWAAHGWNLASCSAFYHIAFRGIPAFANHFLIPPPSPRRPVELAQ